MSGLVTLLFPGLRAPSRSPRRTAAPIIVAWTAAKAMREPVPALSDV